MREKLGKELNYIKREYTKKLKVVKDNLTEEFNDYIDWNTAEVLIVNNIAGVKNFYGDVHVKLRTNISNKQMMNITEEIKNLLKENKVGICIEEYDFYEDIDEDDLFFENEEIELVFYNKALVQHCKDYLFEIMFNAFYRGKDGEAFDNIFLDGLFEGEIYD